MLLFLFKDLTDVSVGALPVVRVDSTELAGDGKDRKIVGAENGWLLSEDQSSFSPEALNPLEVRHSQRELPPELRPEVKCVSVIL